MIAKIYPRMSNRDIDKNMNLLTSSFYRLLELTQLLSDKLNITSVISDFNDSEYDIIISRYMGDEINNFDKSKPVFEFSFDSLNGGWFFERYSINDIQYKFNENDKELIELCGDVFFSPQVLSPIGEKDL